MLVTYQPPALRSVASRSLSTSDYEQSVLDDDRLVLLFECLFIYRHTAVLLCVKVKEKTMETKYYYQRTTAQHSTKSQKETRVIKVVVYNNRKRRNYYSTTVCEEYY